jgi:hypothetical protein
MLPAIRFLVGIQRYAALSRRFRTEVPRENRLTPQYAPVMPVFAIAHRHLGRAKKGK